MKREVLLQDLKVLQSGLKWKSYVSSDFSIGDDSNNPNYSNN